MKKGLQREESLITACSLNSSFRLPSSFFLRRLRCGIANVVSSMCHVCVPHIVLTGCARERQRHAPTVQPIDRSTNLLVAASPAVVVGATVIDTTPPRALSDGRAPLAPRFSDGDGDNAAGDDAVGDDAAGDDAADDAGDAAGNKTNEGACTAATPRPRAPAALGTLIEWRNSSYFLVLKRRDTYETCHY